MKSPLLIAGLLLLAFASAIAAEPGAPDESPQVTDEILIADAMEIAFYTRSSAAHERLMRSTRRDLCARTGNHPLRSYGPDLPPDKLDWLCDGTRLRYLSGVQLDGEQVEFGFICNAGSYIEVKYATPGFMQGQMADCVTFSKYSGTERYEIGLD